MFTTDTDFEAVVTLETEMSPVADDLPFNILFLGNWSGSRQTPTDVAPDFRPVKIDRDIFDDVLSKMHARLELQFDDNDGSIIAIDFKSLEDFHPDNIFQQVPLFSNLADLRRKLTNPDTYNQAAVEVRSWIKNDGISATAENLPEDNVPAASSTDLLDQILGKSAAGNPLTQDSNVVSNELSSFVSKIVKPHLVQTDAVEQSNLLLVVDEIISDIMRKILHHPQFQALESSWRGVYLLTRKIETGADLKIFLCDLDKNELAQSLRSAQDLTDSNVYLLLNNQDKSWAVIGCNYDFGLNVDDAAILIRLAKIGSHANVPVISHLLPQIFGLNNFDSFNASDKLKAAQDSPEVKLWNVLRLLPEADYLGLALPRFIARLPYGGKTEPAETFYFEEFTETAHHEQFLWANPCFLCVLLLAQTFSNVGWNLINDLIQDFEGLPLYFYQNETETISMSCAEIIMTQSNAEIIIEQGLMPLISFRDTDRVRLGRFQSIAPTESMLSGKWKAKRSS